MHQVIRAIVFAKDEKEALEKAREVFEKLVNEGHFDYFVTFDEDSPVAGRSRWGNYPVVARADSPEGKQLIDEGMRYTYGEFKRAIEKVRKLLENFSDEEIFEEEPKPETLVALTLKGEDELIRDLVTLGRYYFYLCSDYAYHDIFLYDQDGEPIRTRKELNSVLNKWRDTFEKLNEENPYEDLHVFVVPADVHF